MFRALSKIGVFAATLSAIRPRASSLQIPAESIYPARRADRSSRMRLSLPRAPSSRPVARTRWRHQATGDVPARRTPLRQAHHDGARLQSWVQCVRVCSGPESCCERPAWLGVRAKLGPSVNPVVGVGVAETVRGRTISPGNPARDPGSSDHTGVPGARFPVGVMHISPRDLPRISSRSPRI